MAWKRGLFHASWVLALLVLAACGTNPDVQDDTVTLTVSAEGSGVVESTPAGIDCTVSAGQSTGACVAEFERGAAVSLAATPADGFDFTGWVGPCAVEAGAPETCSLELESDTSVTAQFAAAEAAAMTGDEAVQIAGETWTDLQGVGLGLWQGPAGNALVSLPTLPVDLSAFPMSVEALLSPHQALAQHLAHPLQSGTADLTLHTGTYTFDYETHNWRYEATPSDELVLRWQHEASTTHQVQAVVDWDATGPLVTVALPDGRTAEAPTGASLVVTYDDIEVVDLTTTFEWHATDACGSMAQPVLAQLEGFLGASAARLDIHEVTVRVTEDEQGEDVIVLRTDIDAKSGSADVSVELEAAVAGDLQSEDGCFWSGLDAQSGDAALEIVTPGHDIGIWFGVTVGDAGGSDMAHVDVVDGTVLSDGTKATFEGTFDDANANGIFGDSIIIDFAGGEQVTLENFLLESGLIE